MGTADLRSIAASAEQELRAAGTPERAVHEKRYLKSSLEHAGTSLPSIRACAKRIRRGHPDLTADEVFDLVHLLWSVPLHERRMLAVVVLEQYAQRLAAEHLVALEPLLRDSYTWALVDGLAGDVAASIVARQPDAAFVDETLRRWAHDEGLWIRRSALLAHLHTLSRTGSFVGWERFGELADAMLEEREFFIRKAIGWVLREAGKARPELVAAWLRPRTGRMSGVTLREAVLYLHASDRNMLLVAYTQR